MALIGKIRQRTGLLLGFIGLALLIFVIQEAFNQNSLMGGVRKNVGKVDGNKINTQDYLNAVTAYNERIKVLNPTVVFNDENNAAIRDEVWNAFVQDIVMGKTIKKLGLDVTNEEIAEMFKGEEIHPIVMNFFAQSFTNPQTGQFDRFEFSQALGEMDTRDPSGQFRSLVTQLEKFLREDRVRNKYASLIAKSAYTPTFMAEAALEGNKSAMVSVVSVPYSTIDDEAVKVSDEEIAAYIKKYPKRFKRETSRSVDIVSFELKPDIEDVETIRENLLALAEEYKTTDEDSLFLARYADQGASVSYFTQEEIAAQRPYGAELAATATGAFFGPYENDGQMFLTLVVDRKIVPDSVRASHILMRYTSREDRDAKLAVADQIIADFKAGQLNFAQKAFELSEDPGSKERGGDLGFFPRGMMVPEFNNAVFFDMKVGDIEKVESQFGLHIIVKTGQQGGKPALRLADFTQEIAPSDATSKEIYEKAYAFWQKSRTPEDFDKNSKEQSFQRDIPFFPGDGGVAGMPSSRRIITWAFQEKNTGGVQFFDLDDRYVVVKLSKIQNAGQAPFDDVKAEVKEILSKEKKAALIIKKLEDAAKGGAFPEQIAEKAQGEFLPGITVTFNQDFVSNVGAEPRLVGAAFGTQPNNLSKPVAGDRGVYMVLTQEVMPSPFTPEVAMYKQQLNRMAAGRINFMSLLESIKATLEIKDERFYIF